MIVPPNHPNRAAGDRLAGRQIRIGVKIAGNAIVERLLAPESDLTFGAGPSAGYVVPGWIGADLCLISRGRWLALGPGMSLHMVHETGEDRMQGSFEELSEAGISFPLYINVSRLNIRVNDSLSILMEYVRRPEGGGSLSQSGE